MAQVHKSPFELEIPNVDLATFIFSSGTRDSRSQPQYFDAENPALNFSLEQAEGWVKQWAKGLQDLGFRTNDKVLLYSGNSLYFPIVFWGVVASGCAFTGCSPSSSVEELAYQLADSESRLLVAGPDYLDKALMAADKVGLPRTNVLVFTDLQDAGRYPVRSWTNVWASEEHARSWKWRTFSSKEEAQSASAAINYSSGTTGLPKGAEISHYNIISNSAQVAFKRNMVAETRSGNDRKERLRLSGERWLAPLPMFHAYGQAYYCTTAAVTGCKVFIMPKYDIQKYLLFLDIYRITFLTGVPTLLVSLAKHPRAASFNLKAIETVLSGSAPLNPEIGSLVQRVYLRPEVQVKQGWGLTETTCSATGFAPDDIDDGRSIGWLNPNMMAKIVPVEEYEFEGGAKLPYTIGEIWISGPNIMKGYYRRPQETSAAIVTEGNNRWFRTGDIGYVDSRGCFYIIDRLKELIKVKGLQVAPAEIEQTLLTHHKIIDAAVVGEKRHDGEYPKAFVVKAPGQALTEKEVKEYIQTRMSRHKWLTAGVVFLAEIPKTPSGKVKRRLLAKQASDHTPGHVGSKL
ncbi:related to 4-coumarate--CoA ligase [Fusarium proliferatum]|nr:related to 4-coumarate--CoA ligase [Fusarium proliferatum]